MTESDFIRGVRLGIELSAKYLDRDADGIDLGNHQGKVEHIAVGNRRCAEILRKYEGDVVFDYLDYDIDFPHHKYRVYEGEKIITCGSLSQVVEAMRKIDPTWTPQTFPKQYALKVWTPDGFRLAEDPYRSVE
jgi:hypothetical protein